MSTTDPAATPSPASAAGPVPAGGFSSAQLALLKGLVWGMGLLLIAGAVALAVRMGSAGDAPAPVDEPVITAAPAPALSGGTLPALSLAPGETVASVALGPSSMALTIAGEAPGAAPVAIIVIDLATGVQTRLPITPADAR